MSDWTGDRVEQLKALNSEGLSASQIARRIGGVSRNAVIGKLTRLGLKVGGGKAAPRTIYPKAKPVRAPVKVVRADPPSNKPESLHVSIIDICGGLCRWPHGEPSDLENFHFCGHPTGSIADVYCPHHTSRAFNHQPQKFIPYVPRRRAA